MQFAIDFNNMQEALDFYNWYGYNYSGIIIEGRRYDSTSHNVLFMHVAENSIWTSPNYYKQYCNNSNSLRAFLSPVGSELYMVFADVKKKKTIRGVLEKKGSSYLKYLPNEVHVSKTPANIRLLKIDTMSKSITGIKKDVLEANLTGDISSFINDLLS